MAANFPREPLGFVVGDKTARIKVEVFIDVGCPFSARAFLKLPALVEEFKGQVWFNVCLNPQPWHAYNVEMGHAAVVASDPIKFLTCVHECLSVYDPYVCVCTCVYYSSPPLRYVFENRTDFLSLDKNSDLLIALAKAAVATGDEHDRFVDAMEDDSKLMRQYKNYILYARQLGVHGTPSYYINSIAAPAIQSGWDASEWREFLTPLLD
jgi:protein-disulfide isomerase